MLSGFFEFMNKFIFNTQGGMFTLMNIAFATFGIGMLMLVVRFVKSFNIFN